jgi:hypothetical protein
MLVYGLRIVSLQAFMLLMRSSSPLIPQPLPSRVTPCRMQTSNAYNN